MTDQIVLYNTYTLAAESPIFTIDSQVTISAMGLGSDDYITFQRVEMSSQAMPTVCGCAIISAPPGSIIGVTDLLCPSCGAEEPELVRVTAQNPTVVIDHPQRSAIRAVFNGDLTTGEVYVTAKATSTDMSALSSSEKGCIPVSKWVPTGLTACTYDGVEIQEIDSCSNTQWTLLEASVWEQTGTTRCGETHVENQEANQCGRVRWVDGELVTWIPTGVMNCLNGVLNTQVVNDCGQLRWIQSDNSWTDTGRTDCISDTIWVEQFNECGSTRWHDTGTSCGEPCVPNWVDTETVRCTGTNVEVYQVDGCGNNRWHDTGTPDVWSSNGEPFCGEGNTYLQPQVNQCGETRNHNTGVSCSEPCVPNWTDTGMTRCTGANIESYQEDGCGDSRWFDTGTPVAWTNTGELYCGGSGNLVQLQTNQCGGTRITDTGTPCEEPCVPNWTNTGTQRCTGAYVENYQIDGCGNDRWYSTGSPVTWTDLGGRRCQSGYYQRSEANDCGTTRWTNIEAIAWTNTGNTRCTGANVEAEQINQCGTLQWVSTGTPVTWTDTGDFQCADGFYQKKQSNQCGTVRWTNIAAITWTNTGETRCTGTNVEAKQSNQCGATRWHDTGTPVAWTNNGAAYCDGGTLKQPQINQCGGSRIFDTGTACGTPAPNNMGGIWSSDCYFDNGAGESTVSLGFSVNSDGSFQWSDQMGTHSQPWVTGSFNPSDYEARLTITTGATPPADGSFTGSALNTWVNLGSSTLSGSWWLSSNASRIWNIQGHIDIRRVGAGSPEGGVNIGHVSLRVNNECD